MKKWMTGCLLLSINLLYAQQKDTTLLEPLEIIAVKAGSKTPVAQTNFTKEEIQKQNAGRDIPFLLNQAPAIVVNSDAGTGIGYTGIRIRGTDASRINVTLNSIPYNDAESQGTFFVDLPDFASSSNNIQIQRGVGTSTNGAGAFGATINISTNENERNKSFEFNNSMGSYGTMKNTAIFHSGLFAKNFLVDARLSNISSDGYVDRATAQLQSFYISSAYLNDRSSLRFNIFSGKEKTYQAWYGINEETLRTKRRFNAAGTEKSGEPYENETDNYTQTHYQLFFNKKINNHWKFNVAGFATKGKGYYEQYKASALYSEYGLADYNDGTTVKESTDLIRRLWLDNIFFGNIFSVNFTKGKTRADLGGGWNNYRGKHYGTIEHMDFPVVRQGHRWYYVTSLKQDHSLYLKLSQALSEKWEVFADLQGRNVIYTINGFRFNPDLHIKNNYFFFNPKAGLTFTHKKMQAYISYAKASKEPNRDDFEASAFPPSPEHLHDFEAGFAIRSTRNNFELNLYYMLYKDQLILTGKINDVGAYARTNVPESYRTGIEISNRFSVSNRLSLSANVALSENKVINFNEFIDDYDNGGQIVNQYKKSDLAFSPSVVAGSSVEIKPTSKSMIILNSKYVGRQFLDNTSNRSRSLHSYVVHDARASYLIKNSERKKIEAFVNVYNLFSQKYESNGYTFSYLYEQALITENYYFPMAPLNIMAGINLKF